MNTWNTVAINHRISLRLKKSRSNLWMYALISDFPQLQAWRKRAACTFLRPTVWLSLTACFLQTPWWSSCWTWVHLKTDEQLLPPSHTLSEVTNFGQYLHLSLPVSSCWRSQWRWLEMLWSWEPSIGWKKTSASSVTSRTRTLSVSVRLLVWILCLANQCLVGRVCDGLSLAHGFHYNTSAF